MAKEWYKVVGGIFGLALFVTGVGMGIRALVLHDNEIDRQVAEAAQRVETSAREKDAYEKSITNACARMCKASRVLSCHVSKDPSWTNTKIIAVCLNANPEIVADVEVEGWTEK